MTQGMKPKSGIHNFRVSDPSRLGPQLAPVAWGVSAEQVNNGPFAADYRRAYGELPSETLRI